MKIKPGEVKVVPHSIRVDENLYVSSEWVSNGHWLLKREIAEGLWPKIVPGLRNGTYFKSEYSRESIPTMHLVIPKSFDLQELVFSERARVSPSLRRVESYIYTLEPNGIEINLAPRYVLMVLSAGLYLYADADQTHNQILLMSVGGRKDYVKEDIVGAIMPMRF